MARTVYVTTIEKQAAQLLVERLWARDEHVPEDLLRIANARREYHPAAEDEDRETE